MSGDGFDMSDVQRFTADLGRIASSAIPEVDAVVKRSAQSLKNRMVEDARGSEHFERVGKAWTYDQSYRIGEVAYDSGPDRARDPAAGLAGAYLGWHNGGGASLPLDEPVDRQGERLAFELGEFLGGILG